MVNATRRSGVSHLRRELGSEFMSIRKDADNVAKEVRGVPEVGHHGRVRRLSSTLDYAPLPDSVQKRELELMDTINTRRNNPNSDIVALAAPLGFSLASAGRRA
jgi:hypothetical protein